VSEANLSVMHLTKSFKGVHALTDVSLEFMTGEIHALLGENGAGKSTLCKMLSGAITPDSGAINICDKEFKFMTPHSAKENGIGMIYQEFNLVPEMTVYENLFLGKEIKRGFNVNKTEMIAKTKEIFLQLNIDIDPTAKIIELSVALCQLVEIGKSILENARFLIMDEPTAPLTTAEVEKLFNVVRELKAKGVTIIYISHRIEELLELSDRVTVLRDGEIIKTLMTKETTRSELIKLMVGREISGEFPVIEENSAKDEELLKVENLTTSKIKNISFVLHRGEILGLAGLVGAGRTETVRALFGADRIELGDIWIKGKKVTIKSPSDAIKKGFCLIPEDRKRQGLHLGLPIKTNISLVRIRDLSRFLTISSAKEKHLVDSFINVLTIKLSSPEAPVSSLSGGNQQKVVLSKWLSVKSDIMFFDEPTRGIDVAAKKDIYDLMNRLRNEGRGIIMISSEMMEVIGMCNRVIVMHEGVACGQLSASEMTQERILELASGGVVENQ
jgi:ribose transport system ATP-binding protein